MPLCVGDKLGHYEVLSLLGVGGMGEVYRARDTTLKRDVALKVLPATYLRDSDRMARFQREAQVLASLDHPNIGHIHGIVDSEDSRGLVLALIEGPTLADRIEAGPLPQDEAIAIAKQIVEGLEYAHDRGVVHRDLKPANVKITPEGVVKVLDFGLAKVLEDEPPASSLGNSPTLTLGHTRAGVILGTAAYMSPEQAIGRPVDRRSDIFSFGAVLFEMLTGKRAFGGTTTPDVLEAVVKKDPDWEALPAETPSYLRRLLKRALTKDRKERLQAIGEARIALENADRGEPSAMSVPAATRSRLVWVAWAVAALFLFTTLGVSLIHFRERPPEPRSVRFQIAPPEKSTFLYFRLSPDGRYLAFTAGDRRLWIRALDSLQAQPLPGTDGATLSFWSPDSQSIGFFAQGKLKKIAVAGGPAQIICDARNTRGGAWNRDGIIVFAPSPTSGLFKVPAAGGVPVQITKVGSATVESNRYPEFLPDGRHFVYSVAFNEASGIYVGSLEGKPGVRLLPDTSNAIYAASAPGSNGYLLFRRGDSLMAQPFDPTLLRLSGDAFPVAEAVGQGGFVDLAAFSSSENGTLAYAAGSAANIQLVWMDRENKPMGLFGPPGAYNRFRLAPDEKRIVFDYASLNVGVLDSVRGVATQLTFGQGANNVPMWSPDGLRVLWSSNRNGAYDVYIKSAYGTGQEELRIKMGTGNGYATDWSRDGRVILYQMPGEKTGQDLWIAPQSTEDGGGGGKPFPYLQSQSDEQDGRFSPDGKWIAYVSNESGRDEIYVQSFPLSGAKFQISTGGGAEPQWRNDGTELFFLAADQMLMTIPVNLGRTAAGSFQAGLPKPVILVPPFPSQGASVHSYAVSNDGQRLLIPSLPGGGTVPPITVVLNWQAGLKR